MLENYFVSQMVLIRDLASASGRPLLAEELERSILVATYEAESECQHSHSVPLDGHSPATAPLRPEPVEGSGLSAQRLEDGFILSCLTCSIHRYLSDAQLRVVLGQDKVSASALTRAAYCRCSLPGPGHSEVVIPFRK